MSDSKGERIGMTLATDAFTGAVSGRQAFEVIRTDPLRVCKTIAASDLRFEGIRARYEGDASARALFSVPKESVKALEDGGYLVEFGYMLARAEEAGGFDAMRLSFDGDTGKAEAGAGVTVTAVYRRGERLVPSTEHEEGAYLFAASLPELDPKNKDEKALAEQYRARAYLAVRDGKGEETAVLYRDAVSFALGETFSVLDASEYFLYAGYGASETFTLLFGEAAAETARTLYDSYAECELLCTESDHRASVIERAHAGMLEEKRALDAALSHVGDGMTGEDALHCGAEAATAHARMRLYARTGISAYERAYADASAASSRARALAEEAEAVAMRAGADREDSKKIARAISRRLLALSEQTLSYLSRHSETILDMNELIHSYANDAADKKIAAAFGDRARRVTLDGADLSEYLIVVGEKTEEAGALLQRLLIANAGVFLGVYNHESGGVGEHFDYASERAITVGLTKAMLPKKGRGYAVYSLRRFLCIEGSDAEALEAAVSVFAKQLCGNEPQNGTVSLSLTPGKDALIAEV